VSLSELQDYWNKRFKLYGHTGWKIPELHAYDQKVRLKAVMRLLAKTGFLIDECKSVLDIGCGSGDFVFEFAQRQARVVGFDLSNEVVEATRQRFELYDNVEIVCMSVENTHLPEQSFDLITSITVLQHIPSDQQLLKSLQNLFGLLKPDGYLLLLETVVSEAEKSHQEHLFYLNQKTRREWIELFDRAHFVLVREESYPQFALAALQYAKHAMDLIKSKAKADGIPEDGLQNSTVVDSHLVKLFLALFIPFDLWFFVPFPRQYAKQRIFLLKK
jgi:2-polyprenyl-3-methyl-5-hydroxy-6-metoxy-1,4-benzoquinol methylase